MVQQYLWKGGGANWLWSALIDNCWIFEAKANFFSFGGCWVKILVPHSAVFLIQKAKTGWRGIVEGDTSLKKCLNARRRRGEGLFAIVCWQWRNLNIKRQPTKPLWDLSRWIFCWELWRFEFLAAMAALYLHLCVEWWPHCGPTSEFLYKKWFKSNFKGHKYVGSLKFSPFCDWFSACELHW